MQRGGGQPLALGTIVLTPRHLTNVEAEIHGADVVVLADLGPVRAGEVVLRVLGGAPLIAKGLVDGHVV